MVGRRDGGGWRDGGGQAGADCLLWLPPPPPTPYFGLFSTRRWAARGGGTFDVGAEEGALDVAVRSGGAHQVAVPGAVWLHRKEVGRELDHAPLADETGQHLVAPYAADLRLRPIPIWQADVAVVAQGYVRSSHRPGSGAWLGWGWAWGGSVRYAAASAAARRGRVGRGREGMRAGVGRTSRTLRDRAGANPGSTRGDGRSIQGTRTWEVAAFPRA